MHPRLAQLASTSGRHSTCHENYLGSLECSGRSFRPFRSYGRRGSRICTRSTRRDGRQAQAIAVTWEEVALQQNMYGNLTPEGWIFEEQEQTDEAVERPTLQNASRGKPLKINRDLLLHRAKLARMAAFRASNVLDRLRLQREAESILRRCLAMDGSDGRTYVALGKLFVQQRRYDEAREIYEEGSTATGGQNEYIWQSWATLEAKCGNASKARKLYDAALVANRKHVAAWHGWGLLEKRQGNFTKAKDLWMRGIRETQGTPSPYLYQSVAVLAGEMGLIEEARKWFREGTRSIRGKGSHALWHAWATLEAEKGETSAVRYLFRKGIEANPRSRYIHLAWAMFEKKQGEVDNARNLFKRGHKLNPLDAAILQAWALLEQEQGNIEEARQLFEAGSRADPHHLYIWQAWGVLEHRAGNLDRARDLFQQGVWAQPKDRDVALVWQAWGYLEAKAGNVTLARQLYKCAVKADPNSEASWLAWAALEESEGAFQKASELRSYRMQNWNEIVLPANFGATFAAEPADAPLKKVLDTIMDWFSKVDNARSIAKRPPPSYMRLEEEEQPKEATEEVPPLDEMRKYDSSELRLPSVPEAEPAAEFSPRTYNWTASPDLPMRS